MRIATVWRWLPMGLVVLSVVVSACGGDDTGSGTPLNTVSELIGPAGGTVELVGGGKVEIPAGALSETTTITVTEVDPKDVADLPSNLEAAGKPFAFKPHRLSFAQPVKISLPFTGNQAEVRPLKLEDEDDSSWQTVVGATKTSDSKLELNTSSFSVYVPARPRRDSGVITLPDGAILDGSTIELDAGNDATTEVDASNDATPDDASNDATTGDAGSDAMVFVDRCLTNNGGCDPSVTCTDNNDPQVICGACPVGTLGSGATACVTTTQEAYVKASNAEADDAFGTTLAIDGDTLVVGAPYEASTVAGGPSDNSALGAGAVYVFTRNGSSWTQQAMLKASNSDIYDFFGQSVAVSGDTIVVGAPGESGNGINGESDNSTSASGAVYVFTRSGTLWTQQAYLKASNVDLYDSFGSQVTIDGDTLAVAASAEASSATGINGNQADNSAEYSGAVYVFTRSGNSWSQQAYLKASNTEIYDNFGNSIAVSGDTIVVGAQGESSGATGVNSDESDNTAYSAGAAYVFTRVGSSWSQQAYLKPNQLDAEDFFGQSVAVSGDTIVVGTPGDDSNATGINGDPTNNSAEASGAAHVFTRNGGIWTQDVFIKPSNTELNGNIEQTEDFGAAVAIDNDVIVVGAPYEDSNATGLNGDQLNELSYDSGAAYVYSRNNGTWSQAFYAKASNTGDYDNFGSAVAVSGVTFTAGASCEASAATGINNTSPGELDDTQQLAGAVYVFH